MRDSRVLDWCRCERGLGWELRTAIRTTLFSHNLVGGFATSAFRIASPYLILLVFFPSVVSPLLPFVPLILADACPKSFLIGVHNKINTSLFIIQNARSASLALRPQWSHRSLAYPTKHPRIRPQRVERRVANKTWGQPKPLPRVDPPPAARLPPTKPLIPQDVRHNGPLFLRREQVQLHRLVQQKE